MEEVKLLEDEIEAVKAKVEDPVMCEKIKRFVYAPKEIQDTYKLDAGQSIFDMPPALVFSPIDCSILCWLASENINLLTIVLRSGDEPILSRAQLYRVGKANRAHSIYMKQRETLADSDDDDGPQDDDAWLYEDLKILGHLYSRLRDREQLIALIFEVRSRKRSASS